MNYLKISKATDLKNNKDRKLYRFLEIIPGALSWVTLLSLSLLSYYLPILVAYFLIAFDVYWLLLVLFLGVYLVVSYQRVQANLKKNWTKINNEIPSKDLVYTNQGGGVSKTKNVVWQDLIHIVIFPVYNESWEVIQTSFDALVNSTYPLKNIIIAITVEERGGKDVYDRAKRIKQKLDGKFQDFILTQHPDGIAGELKGKGSNQAWAAEVLAKYIEEKNIDRNRLIVSVFDIDTVIYPEYFYVLNYNFLTHKSPYRTSYQPVPVYHNNVWQAPFFARVAASSNTFWQMMQQVRQEKLATYSSHAMSWRALEEIGFWSKSMVSEDSRIFWHCFCYYNGDYEVTPLYYPVSMDVTMDEKFIDTAINLYKQQRRWGWGVENVPYLVFNTIKNWRIIPKKKFFGRILIQVYGFHSWATNALIIAFIGWLPLIIGGDRFNTSVLSTNLPFVTRTLMTIAMSGLVLSAILSTLLLPRRPRKYGAHRYFAMILQWILLPVTIIIFGAFPGLDAQTRLMLGKYMGFWVTPKSR